MGDGTGEEREPRVVRLALDVVEFCDGIERGLLRRGKVALNAQLQDSSASALSNVGEGWDDPNPREKRRFFYYALRSCGECQRQLRGAGRIRAITPEELREGLRRLLDLKSDLLRLIAWCTRRLGE